MELWGREWAETRKNKVPKNKGKSPQKARGLAWKEADVRLLLEIIREETILFSLDNAKTRKEKRAAYINVQVKLQTKVRNLIVQ